MSFYFHNMRYSIKSKDMFKRAKNIQLKKRQKIAYFVLSTPFLNSKQLQYKLTESPKVPRLSMLLAITFENLCQVTLVILEDIL